MSIHPLRRSSLRSDLRGVLFALIVAVGSVHADVATFEGFSFPEDEDNSWEYTPVCQPQRWVRDGWLFQHVEVGCGGPNAGDIDRYQRSLADFVGEEHFFIEFRMETDGDRSEIPGVAPAALAAGGFFGISYDFVISRDLLRFQRDDFQVTVFVEIEPGVPHTYRLELHGADEYFVYIDGEEINSGVPGGQYPSDEHDVMAWRAKAWFLPNTTQWDYVRIGTTPQVGSGDFDSDGEVDFDDLPFFQECLTTPAGNWVGCRWADMDFDSDTDCDDWFAFLAAWTDPADPPAIPECDCNPAADLDCDGSVGPFDLATLLAAWGPCPDPLADCPADLNGDGTVGPADLAMLLASWG